MKYIKYAFLILLGLIILTVALANRALVTLQLLPDALASFTGSNWSLQLPLFLIILGSVIVGLLIGFIWEWLREYRIRNEAARAKRRVNQLEAEVTHIRKGRADPRDDVLALLEDRPRAG